MIPKFSVWFLASILPTGVRGTQGEFDTMEPMVLRDAIGAHTYPLGFTDENTLP
jgi:hypothetical protein